MEIEFSNICYRDKLVDISYKFSKGRVTSIIGNSGSGKSLIGYVIMGLVKDYEGEVIVDGSTCYDKYDFFKNISYVFLMLWDHFICKTVYDEIAFSLKNFKYKDDKIDKQVRDALKMVGLDDNYFTRELNTLSSGEASRVAIATAIATNPKVFILDEPTIYIDVDMRNMLIKLIKKLKDKYNKTFIIMSDDMDFVYAVSDNYVLLDKGMIIKSGEIDEIKRQSDVVSSCSIYVSKFYDFINFVNEYKGVNLEDASNIDDIVQEVIARE